jgi:hypothetical protein
VKTWRKFAELLGKNDEVRFGHHWHILLVKHIPLTSKGGLEHMMGLCEVCALVFVNCGHQKRHTFILWVITGDEAYIYGHNQETK